MAPKFFILAILIFSIPAFCNDELDFKNTPSHLTRLEKLGKLVETKSDRAYELLSEHLNRKSEFAAEERAYHKDLIRKFFADYLKLNPIEIKAPKKLAKKLVDLLRVKYFLIEEVQSLLSEMMIPRHYFGIPLPEWEEMLGLSTSATIALIHESLFWIWLEALAYLPSELVLVCKGTAPFMQDPGYIPRFAFEIWTRPTITQSVADYVPRILKRLLDTSSSDEYEVATQLMDFLPKFFEEFVSSALLYDLKISDSLKISELKDLGIAAANFLMLERKYSENEALNSGKFTIAMLLLSWLSPYSAVQLFQSAMITSKYRDLLMRKTLSSLIRANPVFVVYLIREIQKVDELTYQFLLDNLDAVRKSDLRNSILILRDSDKILPTFEQALLDLIKTEEERRKDFLEKGVISDDPDYYKLRVLEASAFGFLIASSLKEVKAPLAHLLSTIHLKETSYERMRWESMLPEELMRLAHNIDLAIIETLLGADGDPLTKASRARDALRTRARIRQFQLSITKLLHVNCLDALTAEGFSTGN